VPTSGTIVATDWVYKSGSINNIYYYMNVGKTNGITNADVPKTIYLKSRFSIDISDSKL